MEKLPPELWLGILGLLDHQSLATAQLVCRKLRSMGSDDTLWYNLFLERWGEDRAAFFSPAAESKCWKDVYVTQDRGDRVGLKLRSMGSDDTLWYNLFLERWGEDRAAFFSPAAESKCWKDVYVTQDRGDRVGLGLKITREGDDYYLVHLGEIQRHLGTRTPSPLSGEILADENASGGEEPCSGILDKILFFIGDLDSSLNNVKRSRVL